MNSRPVTSAPMINAYGFPAEIKRYTKIAGTNHRRRRAASSFASSHDHQSHGIHANPASAPNQSVAAQMMIHPFNDVMSAARVAYAGASPRCRARSDTPVASNIRYTIESAAALPWIVSGRFQTAQRIALKTTENVPHWNSPARFPDAQVPWERIGHSPARQARVISSNIGPNQS